MIKRSIYLTALLALALNSGCFLKFWGKDDDPNKPAKVKVYDIYGTVENITREQLVVTTKRGKMEFKLADHSLKGSDFGAGATVHVYYKQVDGVNEVTMVVERIK